MIKQVGILGAGQMGLGIAQVFQTAGFEVILYDIRPLPNIPFSLSSRLEDLASADLILEAVREEKSTKAELFKKLDMLMRREVCFLSNTSSISLSFLASVTQRPDKIMGLHFMNPAPKMPLVELVHADTTSQETIAFIEDLCQKINKVTIHVKDRPGFIVNRLLIPMLNEAMCALEEGIASREDIDKAMTLGTHHPMGPLALADLIGLDTCLAIMQTLYKGFQSEKYHPSHLLETYVNKGWLGKKTKKGFYEY